MGYTHSWERPRILPRPPFVAAVADCRRLCDTLKIPLGDGIGQGEPIFSDDEICFNGRVDSGRVLGPGRDGSCETFHIPCSSRSRTRYEQGAQEWCGGFCKTNHQPYDLCVQGCLIVLSHHLGRDHFHVSSDGKSDDWNDARDACQQILGYGIDFGEDKLAPVAPSQ